MRSLFGIEFRKLWQLSSLRVTGLLLVLFPLVWAYAPGVFDTYGFYMVSAYQVPALSLLSSMEFLLPLLVAIASAELLGLEVAFGTLPTVLLRPVTRSRWLIAKLGVVALYPFFTPRVLAARLAPDWAPLWLRRVRGRHRPWRGGASGRRADDAWRSAR